MVGLLAIASGSDTSGPDTNVFSLVDGKVQPDAGNPDFTLAAPEAVWTKFLLPVPPRHHHGIFAMHYRVPEFAIQGDQLVFMQHAHVARRILEVGKWLALGHKPPVPLSLAPRAGRGRFPRSQRWLCPGHRRCCHLPDLLRDRWVRP